jgi:AcrR family transcriptional regulator
MPTTTPRPRFAPEPLQMKDVSTLRKRKILLAAEKLFSVQAYSAVSMRDIAKEADLSLALLSYHFGSKLDLLHAVFDHRSSYVVDRLAALEDAKTHKGEPDALEQIVTAYVHRALELRAHPESEHFMRLVARQVSGGDEEARSIVREYFDPLARAFIAAIQEAVPGSDRGPVTACYIFALGSLLNATVDDRLERLSESEISSADAPVLELLLVNFISAGIRQALGAGSGSEAAAAPAKPRKSRRP